jgi:hypothetical protein
MPPSEPLQSWLFVAHNTLHLEFLKNGAETWWCVDRRCNPNERAFIYKPLIGITLQFEILEILKKPELFCNAFQMATARIKLLNVFDPPITSKEIKLYIGRKEVFIRRNFQGKSFVLQSPNTPTALLALAQKKKEALFGASVPVAHKA